VVVVLGVGRSRAHRLGDRPGVRALHEAQDRHRLIDTLAAHLVEDEADLLGGDLSAARVRLYGDHYFFLTWLTCAERLVWRRKVRAPSVGFPHGLRGPGRPIGARPSPPPCGWSRGFMTVPRTLGLRPIKRLRPARPSLTWLCSTLPTWPMVAMQSAWMRRTSP